MRAVTFCNMYSFSKESLDYLLRLYPEVGVEMQHVCGRRLQRWRFKRVGSIIKRQHSVAKVLGSLGAPLHAAAAASAGCGEGGGGEGGGGGDGGAAAESGSTQRGSSSSEEVAAPSPSSQPSSRARQRASGLAARLASRSPKPTADTPDAAAGATAGAGAGAAADGHHLGNGIAQQPVERLKPVAGSSAIDESWKLFEQKRQQQEQQQQEKQATGAAAAVPVTSLRSGSGDALSRRRMMTPPPPCVGGPAPGAVPTMPAGAGVPIGCCNHGADQSPAEGVAPALQQQSSFKSQLFRSASDPNSCSPAVLQTQV